MASKVMGKTWFITGTSSGIGRLATERLLARGHRVAATLRRPERLSALAAQYGDQLWVRELDVTDVQAIGQVVDAALDDLGPIDVVLSNAGYGLFGTAEELSDPQIADQIATNLIAPIHLARAFLPHLRGQGSGHILHMSSMGGLLAVPGLSLYHATKWGAEGFFESVGAEVAPYGVKVTLIEPGIIRTSFHDGIIRGQPMDAYADNPALLGLTRDEIPHDQMIGDPAKVVDAIIAVTERSAPPRRLLLGSDAYSLVHAALTERLEAVESQRDSAALSDFVL
jgi:NAD(P)-dependent dehydrogenase (short-subunit alcohol dehydrogenase family)